MRTRVFSVILACVAVSIASLSATAHAATWPFTPTTLQRVGPTTGYQPHPASTWCGRQFDGSFGNSYFSTAQVWVNYGGNCNVQWGRPAGTIRTFAQAFSQAGTLTKSTNSKFNASNVSFAQADFVRSAGDHCFVSSVSWNPSVVTGAWLGPGGIYSRTTCLS